MKLLIESVNADTVRGYVEAHPEYDTYHITIIGVKKYLCRSDEAVQLFGDYIVDVATFSYESIPHLKIKKERFTDKQLATMKKPVKR